MCGRVPPTPTARTPQAEPAMLALASGSDAEALSRDFIFQMWLARCLVMNGNARQAWELYLKTEGTQESFAMLQLLANDCYRAGAFLHAAKAFETLERLDPNPGDRPTARSRIRSKTIPYNRAEAKPSLTLVPTRCHRARARVKPPPTTARTMARAHLPRPIHPSPAPSVPRSPR